MFQPARPWLRWSSEANLRATWKGKLKLVEAVAMRPMLRVTADSAASRVMGSKLATYWATRPTASGSPGRTLWLSARKMASIFAASAIRASSM